MKRFCLITMLVLTGCAASLLKDPPRTDEEYYTRSKEYVDDGLYPEAMQILAALKVRFPYSQYVALADLGIADIHFDRGRYIEAVDAYRSFLKYHPQHEKAPFAMLRIAQAYKEQIPSTLFFLPPAAEKDQASTRLAISAYKDMLSRFPQSDEAVEAKEELDVCRLELAKHEIYVARFYYTREKWKAAAGRAEGLLRDYAGLGLDSEALLIAAESRFALGDHAEALQSASRLETEFPDTDEAEDTAELLTRLRAMKLNTDDKATPASPREG
ncbi:MAG: outer membrane protein assembly factor BamD [Myxococcota bacterium]